MGGKGLTGTICSSLFLNPFSPRPAQTGPFIILLSLTPDNFTPQGRACGWERVNTQGCNLWFTSSQKLEYLVFTIIVHVGCLFKVLFWKKFFFSIYFCLSKIFRPYFYFYLKVRFSGHTFTF